MKRWLPLLAMALIMLSACGSAPASAPAAATDSPGGAAASGDVDTSKLSKELFFYNWSDYIDPSILADFEQEYGVKVTLDTYDANEDMIAKVRAGNSGYDIVVPSDYAVTTMAAEGLIISLDKSLLTNLSHMSPDLLNKYFDEGNVYSIPYMYGISGIAYNQKNFPDGVDSWSALFDPAKIAAYSGKFSMLDDERESPGAALKLLGKSLNDTEPADLKAAEDLLIAQKPFLAAYNSSDVNRKLASEEYVIAHAWSGQAIQAHNGLGDEFSGNPDILFTMPKEGGMIWMDNLAILKDSPNAYTAHVFINFLMRPDIAARNTEYIGYLSPNKDAVDLLSQDIKDLYAQGFAPDAEMIKRLEWAERNEKTTAFTDVWTVVKGE
ncbi:spermidine/putrescine ABC transporter substrate-binding protein [Oscillochloris sp. ZM17-4]|uniref:polyamine ABC transporter substrate-binding protein n=1 Tax=Oscillochloris sp. ZM17-4 TaxID=2866714 RepID=UPI001C731BD4|nr:spermidine/putrescine ABC transporter substrate-binding protein [Oscillochloris sp. ZM17-4]MBX0326737.1 spermidine/putrescine ABC transporter substrate-binding protein [Oscillochloris sp. ZM17-4]